MQRVGAMKGPGRVVVAASGGGSNFQALIDRFGAPGSPAMIAGLVTSRGTAGAIQRARAQEIPVAVLPEKGGEPESDFLLRTIQAWGADLVVLAGYMRLVPPDVVRDFRGRIINIHPALLPSFGGQGMYGERVHRAVVESGARVTGATVHFVDEAYDRGPIIAQWPVPVLSTDTPDTVAARVLEIEHALLPAVVEVLTGGIVSLDSGGRVRWRREWFAGEGFQITDGVTPGGLDPSDLRDP